jgi:hypothetical protein
VVILSSHLQRPRRLPRLRRPPPRAPAAPIRPRQSLSISHHNLSHRFQCAPSRPPRAASTCLRRAK